MDKRNLPETHFKYSHPVIGSLWTDPGRREVVRVHRSGRSAVEWYPATYHANVYEPEPPEFSDVSWFIGYYTPEPALSDEDLIRLRDPAWIRRAREYLGVSE